MKTVLVTGGCGFIGSHFVRLLLQRTAYRVVNLDKLTYAGNLENLAGVEEGERYRFVKGDICSRTTVDQLFQEERPWAVVNFAAESHVDRSILDATPFLQTNVIGVQILLDGSRSHDVERFVQISTDEVYGDADGKEPFPEESLLMPSSPYAASKAAGELLCPAYQRTYGLPILIVRSTNNYGPVQFPEKLVPLMIRNALGGKDLPIYGDGLQHRDWLYVVDNCRAILTVLQQGNPGSIYNIGAGEEPTNLELVHTICRLLAEEAKMDLDTILKHLEFVPDRPGHDRRYALNTENIRQDLAWVPEVSFEIGLRKTIRWYLGHRDWMDRVISGEYQRYYDAVYSRAWEQASA